MRVMHNGKTIGILRGRTLIKSGKQVVLMRSMDGFGMPRDIVEATTATSSQPVSTPSQGRTSGIRSSKSGSAPTDIEFVEIHYLGKVYRASLDEFLRHGVHYYRPPYEPQYILPRKFFSTEDKNQMRLI